MTIKRQKILYNGFHILPCSYRLVASGGFVAKGRIIKVNSTNTFDIPFLSDKEYLTVEEANNAFIIYAKKYIDTNFP